MTGNVISHHDIDTKQYVLADWRGYDSRAEAYAEIAFAGMKNCTVFFVKSKNCWAIVCPRPWK